MYFVTTSIAFVGYNSSSFGATQTSAFTSSIAAVVNDFTSSSLVYGSPASILPTSVAVLAVNDVNISTSRRFLLSVSAGLNVTCAITTLFPDAVTAAILAPGFATQMTSACAGRGLIVSGLFISVPPSTSNATGPSPSSRSEKLASYYIVLIAVGALLVLTCFGVACNKLFGYTLDDLNPLRCCSDDSAPPAPAPRFPPPPPNPQPPPPSSWSRTDEENRARHDAADADERARQQRERERIANEQRRAAADADERARQQRERERIANEQRRAAAIAEERAKQERERERKRRLEEDVRSLEAQIEEEKRIAENRMTLQR